MRLGTILQDFVAKKLALKKVRATKINAVIDMAHSLLHGTPLTLTHLGINMPGIAKQRNKIKKVDRWLGNEGLHGSLLDCYGAIFEDLLKSRKLLNILVDWSGCCNWDQCCLRASLVYSGRSIVIYQEIHDNKTQQKPKIHREFLRNLHKIIPNECQVTIITDRGFQTKWFKMVQEIGWDFIGRAHPQYCCQIQEDGEWKRVDSLYSEAKTEPKYLGNWKIGKRDNLSVHFYAYKSPHKKRKGKRVRNKAHYPALEKAYKKVNKTPWILVTSHLPDSRGSQEIVNNYHSRMQIEQNFRDDKSERFGFAFRLGRTKTAKRISILYLVAAISSYILMLIGVTAENGKHRWDYQASSRKDKRSVSLLTLAKRILKEGLMKIPMRDIIQGFKILAEGPKSCSL